MSQDRLKQFVEENQSQFDNEKAPSHIWGKIDQELSSGSNQVSRVWKFISIGLLILVIFAVGLYVGKSKPFSQKDQQQNLQYAQVMPDEVQEMESYYNTLLNDKKQRLQVVSNNSSISDEMQVLDNSYEELKNDYVNYNGNDQELMLHLMIENYKLRIQLLEMTLNKSTESKHNQLNNNLDNSNNEY